MKASILFRQLTEAGKDFIEDDVPQAAAALSFYAVTALPPLIVILISFLGMAYADGSASEHLARQVSDLFGPSAGEMVGTIVENRSGTSHGMAAVTGLVVLLLGASGFFAQLQKALNQVWEVRPKPSAGFALTVKKRLLSMTAVLGTGFLLLTSLLLSAAISAASDWLDRAIGMGATLSLLGEAAVTFAVVTGLFALIFKFLPDAIIEWSEVWRGATVTAALFMIGKFALGLYLGQADFAADYGSAGALVLVLFWVYYSSMILLFGAELTQVQAKAKGREIQPELHAEKVVTITETADGSETELRESA